MATRLHLPFEVLSDSELLLTRALRLPTFRYGDWTLLKRHTLILTGRRIEEVFYPVFPPDADAGNVLRWLRERAVSWAAGGEVRWAAQGPSAHPSEASDATRSYRNAERVGRRPPGRGPRRRP